MELDECTELFIRGKNIYILLPSLTFSIFICFALKHKLLKLEWHCRSDVLPTDSCQPMLIHTVVNDKKDLPLQRDRLRVKFKFSGGRVLCETADYGSDPHSWCWASTPAPAVLGKASAKGLRETQTTSGAFRQKHCASFSSRGCLTGSSHFKVLLGLIGCQATRPIRTDSLSSVIFSVFCLFFD